MSTVFVPTSPAGMPEHQIQVHGAPTSVVTSYPPWAGLQLHSLTVATAYRCDACGQVVESAMIATGDHILACPGCFARLAREDATTPIPKQRRPPVS